jgi:hypothetical protein
MRWLIVSTNPAPHLPDTDHPHSAGWNPGDVFARLGTEQIIRDVDSASTFDLLNMDSHLSLTTPRQFDRCVLAGRPLFWPWCEQHPLWTHVLNGWPSTERRKLLALGVGSCCAPEDRDRMPPLVMKASAECWRVVIRDEADTADALHSVCPSTWLLSDRTEKPRRKLCNVMVGGGHYPQWNLSEFAIWGAMVPAFMGVLMGAGFEFVAHTQQERDLALSHGWPAERIVYADTIEPYLDAYASASHYIGNRMHGAVVLAGRMARTMAIGYDSRMGMVRRAGGETRLPSQLSISDVLRFAQSKAGEREARRVRRIAGERQRMTQLVAEFAS